VFPIGGYVKIVGMVDESMDTDFVEKPPQPWEFRSKNTLQKAFMISAGVIMNFLLAILIFAGIAYFEGKTAAKTTTIEYVEPKSPAEEVGFKSGDKILAIDGKPVLTWDEVMNSLALKNSVSRVEFEREGVKQSLNVSSSKFFTAISKQESPGLNPSGTRTIIQIVETLRPAGKAGLKTGDTIISINNQPVLTNAQFMNIVSSNKETALPFVWKRGDQIMQAMIAPDKTGKIGVQIGQAYTGPILKTSYGVFESLEMGWNSMINAIKLQISGVVSIFQGKVAVKQAMGGPVMIAKMATQTAGMGLITFLSFMAMLSVTLAVMNILPLPALDGGHLVFIILEGVFRREIPAKIKIGFQQVGVFMLLALMVFVMYNDLTR
ncbi:MAG TPA: RIP metalloprotease RseP, partial [Patescibacteria group bacterium]|nr:RIP metalloprotease RseP [Patescibacteria group bacterium]